MMKSSALASLRIYWLAVVLCCGGILFGYDSGVIGMLVLATRISLNLLTYW